MNAGPTRIELADAVDADAILDLVARNGLPLDGLHEHLPTTVVARDNGTIVGTAALELYTDGALLRSVAVAPERQGHGLNHKLTQAAIDLAEQRHAPAVYLLTTTADGFFPKFAFQRLERAEVPAGVQTSVEFAVGAGRRCRQACSTRGSSVGRLANQVVTPQTARLHLDEGHTHGEPSPRIQNRDGLVICHRASLSTR
jgi:amino-acid N-acetyltransferase